MAAGFARFLAARPWRWPLNSPRPWCECPYWPKKQSNLCFPGRCVVDFTVGRTIVPAAVTHGKNPDTRELGAHFLRFVYLPR